MPLASQDGSSATKLRISWPDEERSILWSLGELEQVITLVDELSGNHELAASVYRTIDEEEKNGEKDPTYRSYISIPPRPAPPRVIVYIRKETHDRIIGVYEKDRHPPWNLSCAKLLEQIQQWMLPLILKLLKKKWYMAEGEAYEDHFHCKE